MKCRGFPSVPFLCIVYHTWVLAIHRASSDLGSQENLGAETPSYDNCFLYHQVLPVTLLLSVFGTSHPVLSPRLVISTLSTPGSWVVKALGTSTDQILCNTVFRLSVFVSVRDCLNRQRLYFAQ